MTNMPPSSNEFDFDFVVIGSGFGGSVCAHRLVEKGYRVAVMEMGRRWTPSTLPQSSWLLHKWFWRPKLGLRGFFNMRFFRHATIFHGCAVGGGSITYACTLLTPPDKVWETGSWTGLANWKQEMPHHYATAARMLGATPNKILGPADLLLKQTAEATNCGDTFYRTNVGIFQPEEGRPGNETFPDPYFGGDGPTRTTCIACGGCMMGCRFGAKNTLDLGYLYLAEKRGAKIFPETQVSDVHPLAGSADGSNGYAIGTIRSTAWIGKHPRRFTSRGVVFAASSLGTMELLFRLREKNSLPRLSSQLGKHVRTNSESLIGARMPGYHQDLSGGIAIGSGVYIDEHTHIEAVRYPRGSDAMGFLTTILTNGRPGPQRIAIWLKNIFASFIRHPLRTIRVLQPYGWAREFVILLCMQALDGQIEMRWQRPWFWPFRRFLVSRGEKVPTYIPRANAFAEKFAQITGGFPMSMLPEILFDIPGTAHCIGGCVIADSSTNGVVDSHHRAFGYKNMYICDGSVVASLTGMPSRILLPSLSHR